MRQVDIGISPFESDQNAFALHILFDKGQQHAKEYFYGSIVKNDYQSLPEPHIRVKAQRINLA